VKEGKEWNIGKKEEIIENYATRRRRRRIRSERKEQWR